MSIYNIYRDTKRDIDGQLRYGADIYRDIYSFILTEKFHGDIGRSLTFAPEDETNISLNS